MLLKNVEFSSISTVVVGRSVNTHELNLWKLLLDATVCSVMEHILPIVISFFYHCFILCDSYTDSVALGDKLCVDYIGVLFMVMSGLPVETPKRFEFSVEIIFSTAKILIWFLLIQMHLI